MRLSRNKWGLAVLLIMLPACSNRQHHAEEAKVQNGGSNQAILLIEEQLTQLAMSIEERGNMLQTEKDRLSASGYHTETDSAQKRKIQKLEAEIDSMQRAVASIRLQRDSIHAQMEEKTDKK